MRGLGSFAVLLVALAAAMADATQAGGVCNLACIQGTTCEVVNGVSKCVPVECTKKCPKNEKCQINSADNSQYCISPCATIRCMSGYTCQVEQVQCIRAPCPPVGTCKPVKKGYGLRALNEDE
ncbi:hypothetical protein PF005_g16331 [Phytophthora fragariae]|uniref:TIL domain-containing protein n=2 Tax=Phytophthora TaxID=4783 RepID=A0A6A3X7M7_9STRA|nr:hypothetical protein PF003_g18119 [Phytophthora fragariae]KAE9039935.1 hypothetical protein PR002_g5223 [Phytophthora rubi]KAE8932715.1 hypothetical protein PF009_g17262 [Phytophthora fragariae]KAE8997978.1 hypothetical protein PF011_g15248 [Phytophthora fragariae]KAE9045416.1 hypothetical protein PR001_g4982 [Phytophthora rubi]